MCFSNLEILDAIVSYCNELLKLYLSFDDLSVLLLLNLYLCYAML